jgi:putative ABC transport system permease protein
MPIYDVMTLDERIAANLARPRFNAGMLALFAVSALLLAAVGVYGVVAYSVSSRQRDLGVRIALGASARHVQAMVLSEAARLAAFGAAIGIAGALGLTRLIQSLLFGVGAADPAIFAAAAGILVMVALGAAFLPARRASTVDPMIVLRSE